MIGRFARLTLLIASGAIQPEPVENVIEIKSVKVTGKKKKMKKIEVCYILKALMFSQHESLSIKSLK